MLTVFIPSFINSFMFIKLCKQVESGVKASFREGSDPPCEGEAESRPRRTLTESHE